MNGLFDKRIAVFANDESFLGWMDGRVSLAGKAAEFFAAGLTLEQIPYIFAYETAWKVSPENYILWYDKSGVAHTGYISATGVTSSGGRVQATIDTVVVHGTLTPLDDDGTNDLPRHGEGPGPLMT